MAGNMVNKLVVDKDNGLSQRRSVVQILRYTGNQLAKRDMRKFIEVVFRNFEELGNISSLNHNRREIARLVTSPDSLIIIATINNVIVGYVIAEVTVHNMRKLMHIYYLYTSPIHRGKGVATYILNLLQQYSSEMKIRTISLTYDTYDKSLTKFYLNNNFDYDPELRSYQRHDMLVKYI